MDQAVSLKMQCIFKAQGILNKFTLPLTPSSNLLQMPTVSTHSSSNCILLFFLMGTWSLFHGLDLSIWLNLIQICCPAKPWFALSQIYCRFLSWVKRHMFYSGQVVKHCSCFLCTLCLLLIQSSLLNSREGGFSPCWFQTLFPPFLLPILSPMPHLNR